MVKKAEDVEQIAISVTDAAKLLGISRTKMYDVIKGDDFPTFKLGGRTLINLNRLRTWVDEQTALSHGIS